jgi:transcriptional regulator with XRE-family HTH domain
MSDYRVKLPDKPRPAQFEREVVGQARTASTGSSFTTSRLAASALSLLAISAPTGVASAYDFARASQRLSQIPYYDISPTGRGASDRTLRSQVRVIREALAISISDLACILGVSRQAVYKWLGGGTMSDLNQERFEDISAAANILAPHSGSEGLILSRRRDTKGQTLLMALQNGTTSRAWAEDLAQLLQDENRQRSMLSQMIAPNQRSLPGARELGVPLLDEQLD